MEMVDWEAFYKWLEGKLTFQAFIVGATLFLMGVAKVMSSQNSQQSQEVKAQPKYRSGQYRYPTPPKKCRCKRCGFVLEMTGEYAGKHCAEIRKCPNCGAEGRIFWRVE